jgi:uncharacterized membrane protein
MRSMTAPAVVTAGRRDDTAALVAVLALGELLADKLPFVPSRSQPAPLLFRAGSGAFSALRLAPGGDRRVVGVLGAAGAIAGAILFERLRRSVVQNTPIPDFIVALAEDALAFNLGAALVS